MGKLTLNHRIGALQIIPSHLIAVEQKIFAVLRVNPRHLDGHVINTSASLVIGVEGINPRANSTRVVKHAFGEFPLELDGSRCSFRQPFDK